MTRAPSTLVAATFIVLASSACTVKASKQDLQDRAEALGEKAVEVAKDKAGDSLDGKSGDSDSGGSTKQSAAAPVAGQVADGSGVVVQVPRASTPSSWNAVQFTGGNGSSCAQAVVVTGAADQMEGTQAEYYWLSQVHAGYEAKRQSTTACDGKKTHVQEIRTTDGATVQVYFDVSAFVP